MKTIIKAYDHVWFLVGLVFMALGLHRPQDFWFLVLLIPLISGLILMANRHPVLVRFRVAPRNKKCFRPLKTSR